ncbi:basic amino acid ABC transporter substrate-binding protein [Methanococcus voltae]|uniref:Extracellular solute-binding protein family 3 n=1 Tax=Methanococcus voltae (strain ATCC BAA-1334 / A3) TaxID=456320 RepID=D7DUB2_METV3|nr:basic amino acid ABC transporter substrate-binding protein [Methanococcus voltae]MCS3900522.1 polar amino acid transport system substrate-binding protein [Methanococcus voltae]
MVKNSIKALFLVALVAVVVSFAGCTDNGNANSNVEEPYVLTVGSSVDFRPFEYMDENGKPTGFDMDIIHEIGRRLDMEIEIIDSQFGGLIPALNTKKFDCVISAMTITENRSKEVKFSEPYFEAGQILSVNKDNNEITTLEDLSDKKVGVQIATTGDLIASENASKYNYEVKQYNKIGDAFMDMKNGKIDAVLVDNVVATEYFQENPGLYKLTGDLMTSESYGIATRLDDTELSEKIDKALADMKADGTYDEIYNKWFGDN